MLVQYPYYARGRRVQAAAQSAERIYRLPVDAYETEESVVLTASVAGLNLNDLEITLDNGVLVIRGEVNGQDENVEYLRHERFHGKFERRLSINIPVEVAATEATYQNGVLRLVLPKAEAAKPRRIEVNVAH
jgi:HSP20 family protein